MKNAKQHTAQASLFALYDTQPLTETTPAPPTQPATRRVQKQRPAVVKFAHKCKCGAKWSGNVPKAAYEAIKADYWDVEHAACAEPAI